MSEDYLDKIPKLISSIRTLKNTYLQKELNKIGFSGISPSHGAILYYLISEGDKTMTELSDLVFKDRSTVTALVSKLVRNEFTEYISNPDDKRSKKVRVTPKSLIFKNEILNISNRMNERIVNDISDDEKGILINLLLKMKDNFTE